ncbi:hypothetical protein [Streptomyces similanensis]|uniref:4Fe-4S ferredoxin-type domain-containing protein n=1 Tax=Streptomyces similanensis TaxID=1274988 RepID=A0ABP9K3I3_9ACTN
MASDALARTNIPLDVLKVLGLPDLDTVSADQSRGATCVWCQVRLVGATAVDLGERMGLPAGEEADLFEPEKELVRWYPRACPKCTADRAHKGLFAHTPACEQCVDGASLCPAGRILYRLVREGRR